MEAEEARSVYEPLLRPLTEDAQLENMSQHDLARRVTVLVVLSLAQGMSIRKIVGNIIDLVLYWDGLRK